MNFALGEARQVAIDHGKGIGIVRRILDSLGSEDALIVGCGSGGQTLPGSVMVMLLKQADGRRLAGARGARAGRALLPRTAACRALTG